MRAVIVAAIAALIVVFVAPAPRADAVGPCLIVVDATAGDDAADLAAAVDAAHDCAGPVHRVELVGTFVLGGTPLEHDAPVALHLVGTATARAVLDGDGASRILEVPADGGDVRLEHVHLTGGSATTAVGGFGFIDGGAVWVEETGPALTVVDAVLDDNDAVEAGGAIAADEVVLERVALVDNRADLGGAVTAGRVTARRTTFDGNVADGPLGEGGAIRAGIAVTLENVTFVGNRAAVGGAIWLDAADPVTPATLTATFATFVGNVADEGAHLAGVDGLAGVGTAPVSARGTLFHSGVSGGAGAATATGEVGAAAAGDDCVGIDVAAPLGPGSVSDDDACPGTVTTAALATLVDGPAAQGAVGRTFTPTAGSALLDVIDCASGWPAVDQTGRSRPQGSRCDVGAVERPVAAGPPGPDPGDDPRSPNPPGGPGPGAGAAVPTSVPSGEGPSAPTAARIGAGADGLLVAVLVVVLAVANADLVRASILRRRRRASEPHDRRRGSEPHDRRRGEPHDRRRGRGSVLARD